MTFIADRPAFGKRIDCGAPRPYDRMRDLNRILGGQDYPTFTPFELADRSMEGTKTIIKELRRRLDGMAHLGQKGSWAYSLPDHLGLSRALKAEEAHLATVQHAWRRLEKITGLMKSYRDSNQPLRATRARLLSEKCIVHYVRLININEVNRLSQEAKLH